MAQEDADLKNGILTYYLVKVLKEAAWGKNGVFDSQKIASEILRRSKRDGWTQEAVSSGGAYFKAYLKADAIQPFSTF